jgi:hypothetical protein
MAPRLALVLVRSAPVSWAQASFGSKALNSRLSATLYLLARTDTTYVDTHGGW